MMTKLSLCISSEVRTLPYYDGLTDVDNFLDAFECEVPVNHELQALDFAVRAPTARWWGTHKDSFDGWRDYRRMMRL